VSQSCWPGLAGEIYILTSHEPRTEHKADVPEYGPTPTVPDMETKVPSLLHARARPSYVVPARDSLVLSNQINQRRIEFASDFRERLRQRSKLIRTRSPSHITKRSNHAPVASLIKPVSINTIERVARRTCTCIRLLSSQRHTTSAAARRRRRS
jgi:hypothetical protein